MKFYAIVIFSVVILVALLCIVLPFFIIGYLISQLLPSGKKSKKIIDEPQFSGHLNIPLT